ncbi:hypothetical protein U1Q18_026482 [Sarracenia purpurea var. burkii]
MTMQNLVDVDSDGWCTNGWQQQIGVVDDQDGFSKSMKHGCKMKEAVGVQVTVARNEPPTAIATVMEEAAAIKMVAMDRSTAIDGGSGGC